MATNFVQPGDVITVAAPYDRTAGQGALIGTLFGVAQATVLSGATGQFMVTGVHSGIAKLSAQAWTVGALIYWDDTNKHCTTVASGNTPIGCAAVAAANPSSTGSVRLNGAAAATAA